MEVLAVASGVGDEPKPPEGDEYAESYLQSRNKSAHGAARNKVVV